jgi:hypothetical protein
VWHSTGPSRPVNYWKHTQTAMGRLQHARMIASAPSWGPLALRPLIRRNGVEKGHVSLFRTFAFSRSANNGGGSLWACRPRSSRPHLSGEVTPTMSHSTCFPRILLRMLRCSRSIEAVMLPRSRSAEGGHAVSKPSSAV